MTVRVLGQKDGTTAEDHRLGLSLFMASTGAAVLDRRAGIVPYVGACDLTGVSPMVGRISPFVAWVDGTSGANQGGYPVVVDANVDLTHDAGEAGNSRIDRYVLQIRDNPYDASTFQDARVVIVKGQAGGAANAVPASSLLLWEVLVPTGASVGGGGFTMSSARTDKRTYTAAQGGNVSIKDATERAALTAYESLGVWRQDLKVNQVYTGSAWRNHHPVTTVQTCTNLPGVQTDTTTSPTSLGTITVSDPGYPYRVECQAQGEVGCITAAVRWDNSFRIDGSSGTGFGFNTATATGAATFCQTSPAYSAVLTGAHTFHWVCVRVIGSGGTHRITAFNSGFTCKVIPAFSS